MNDDRALVVCRTEAGVRAAAWLAHHGVAVRLLCTGPFPRPLGAGLAYRGRPEQLGTILGEVVDVRPSTALSIGSATIDAPRRKRDLLAAVGAGGPGGLARYVVGRALRPSDNAMEWVCRWLGAAVWDEAIGPWLAKRLGGPAARVPAGVAYGLFGRGDPEGWWAPGHSGSQRVSAWVDGVIEAGGEALEEVSIEEIEIEHGRIVAVVTEFGRELVEGRLITDLPPGELAALLPDAAGLDRVELSSWPLSDRVEVEVKVEAEAHPWLRWVCTDRQRLASVRRGWGSAGEPRPDRLIAELVLPAGDAFHGADDAALGELATVLLDGLCTQVGSPLRVRRHRRVVSRSFPRVEEGWGELALRYQALGVLPVGETGWGLPHDLCDELALLERARDGAVVATLRQQLLGHGAPEEPWIAVGRA